MMKLSILQIFKINIGKHFCMNTSCHRHVWYTTTFAVTSENDKRSSSKLLSSTSHAKPTKKHIQLVVHVQFRQFNATNNYFSEQCVRNVLLLEL